MTIEKARQNWISLYKTFGRGNAEMQSYQEYIAISQGKKVKKVKIKTISKQGTPTNLELFK
jgi:hypothetical protein